MEGRQLREREAIALDLVGVAGISAVLLGLTWLRTSKELGFDPAAALDGVLGQLAVTLPAALLVLGATALELAAGLVLARLARRRPFDSLAEALLAAMVAAVLKDTLLLGLLGGLGLFLAPVLLIVNVAIIAGGLQAPQIAARTLPLTAFPGWRQAVTSVASIPVAALVALVWAGPVILQLASPVVPFIDVLPNYVGPVEHLRTFGWFSPLTATQSPIIGPSRTVLGYDGLMGSLATMTGLSGGLAIAGFILPQTILVAAGAHRLASALRRGDVPVGPWALLAFALSQPFARLADARGTVVVVPLVCLGLAVAAEALGGRSRDRAEEGGQRSADRGEPAADAAKRAADAPEPPAHATEPPATATESAAHAGEPPVDPWSIGRGVVIGLALGAATLVHPVIGFFAIVTVGIAGLIRPNDLAPGAFVGTLTAGLIALPQLATMVGISLPTVALGIWLPLAIAVAILVAREVDRRERLRDGIVRLAEIARYVLLAALVSGLLLAFGATFLKVDKLPAALDETANLALESSGLLLVVLVAGAVLGSRGARSPLVWAGIVVGLAAVALTQVLRDDLGFLGSALRFEVPKTVHYWLSAIVAAGAAAALAYAWTTARLPWLPRVLAVGTFVVVAALPIRPEPIDAYHLGEHRYAETLAIDLHYAGTGFWVGFPDSRTVVDEPRQAILEAVRAEIRAGRLRHDTPVLHVAKSFQQWSSTPLGVFDGVFETFMSLDPEVSHQTVGGRLYGSKEPAELLEQVRAAAASGEFGYVVLEPDEIPDEARTTIVQAGYESIFANDQGEVFRARG